MSTQKFDYSNENISLRIRGLMQENKLDSNKAICLNTGIPESSFSDMLNNRSSWKIKYIAKISMYFGVSTDYLIYGDKNAIAAMKVKYKKDAELEIAQFLVKEEELGLLGKYIASKKIGKGKKP